MWGGPGVVLHPGAGQGLAGQACCFTSGAGCLLPGDLVFSGIPWLWAALQAFIGFQVRSSAPVGPALLCWDVLRSAVACVVWWALLDMSLALLRG